MAELVQTSNSVLAQARRILSDVIRLKHNLTGGE